MRNERNRGAVNNLARFAPKGRLLGKTGKSQTKNQFELEEALDINLSSAFKDFKDGTLGDFDAIRQGATRDNFRQREANALSTPLTEANAASGVIGVLERVAPTFKNDPVTGKQSGGNVSAYAKTLSNQIRKAFERVADPNNMPTVEFLEDNGQPNPNYDPATNTISIHREASQEEVLHEMLHAVTQLYVYKNPNASEVQDLSRSLDSLVEFVQNGGIDTINMSQQHKDRALQVANLIIGLRETGNELDAVLELVAYGTTMRDFRLLLKEIKEEPSEATLTWFTKLQDIWQKTVAMIAELMGIEGTVAGNILDNTLAILSKANLDQRDPSIGGNRLDMSALTPNDQGPVDAFGAPVGDLYRAARKEGRQDGMLSTKIFFDAIKFDKNIKEPLTEKAAAAAEFIRKELPAVEQFVTYFNSRFSLPTALHDIFDLFKEERNTVYTSLERLAIFIEGQSNEKIIGLMEYMDGDITALDKFTEGERLKIFANSVVEGIDSFIEQLPDDLQKLFADKKFTEKLIYVTNDNAVASQSLGIADIGKQLRSQAIQINKTDFDINYKLIDTDINGQPDLDGVFYEVIVTPAMGEPYSLVVSKSIYERNGGQLPMVFDGPYKVIPSREYTLLDQKGQNYNFRSKINYREAMQANEAKDLANAMRNTVGGLANYISSKNFMNSLAVKGKELGVVFENEAALRASGENLISLDQSLLRATGDTIPESVRIATRRTGAWVQIPADAARYGDLAGHVIHGPVYYAMLDMANRKPIVDIAAYNTAIRGFKKAKTIYNPGTHVTNVASNITLAMMHDIPLSTVRDAARLLFLFEASPSALKPAERRLMQDFVNSGALLGNYSSVEVRKDMFNNMSKTLKPQSENVMTRTTAFINYETEKMNSLYKLGKRGAKFADNVLVQTYAAEDNAFRLAAFLKYTGDIMAKRGVTEPDQAIIKEAGRAARQAFLDYDIDSPAVKILRQTLLPFVSWTYAIIPVLGRIAATQPWKIANVLAAYHLLDIATAALAGDDDEMRKLGPERLDERMFGIGPRMHIRIPFFGDDQNPVYYRLGDYVPLASTAKGLPNGFMGQDWFPSGFTPGGPFVHMILGLSGGVDPYTGDKIHKPTDGSWDKFVNNAVMVYDLFSPPFMRSQNVETIRDAMLGNVNPWTGKEVDLANLIFARIGGLKVVDFNVKEEAVSREFERSDVTRKYKAAIKRLYRDEMSKGYPDYEAMNEEIRELYEEMYEEYDRIYKIEDE